MLRLYKHRKGTMKHEHGTAHPETRMPAMPPVPLTLEGWSILHQMFRIRWAAWRTLAAAEQKKIVEEASATLAEMEQRKDGQSAIFSLLGHKGDILLFHFRK